MKLFGGGRKAHHSAVKADFDIDSDSPVAPIPNFGDKMKTVVIRPGGRRKRRARGVLAVIATVVALALILVIGYAIWEEAPAVNEEGPLAVADSGTEADSSAETAETPTIELPVVQPDEAEIESVEETEEGNDDSIPAEENLRNTDCYTFVLAAYDQIGASTDTIMVGRLDVKEGSLNVISVPRDTLVNVSWALKKVNTVMVYEEGDPEKFVNTLSSILGFKVDCYAFVNIKAVEKMVDAIGGVNYNVRRDMIYDDPTQDLHIHIPAGYQHLDGKQAVQVLRYRVGNNNTGYPNGDLGRINTQHDFLKSLASQMLKLGNIPNLSTAIEIFEEYVTTNLSTNNIAFFIREFLKLDEENIYFGMVPGEGIAVRGGSYYEINVVEWTEMLNSRLNPFAVEIGIHNLDVLDYNSENGSVMSTTGEIIPYESFYDFASYKG